MQYRHGAPIKVKFGREERTLVGTCESEIFDRIESRIESAATIRIESRIESWCNRLRVQ